MKVAIKGHILRGKEVIQILESLGGINGYDQSGSNENFVYFINNIGFIYSVTSQICSNEREIYTLEEFEKEFPFKIGDLCIYYSDILDKEYAVKILGMAIKNNCIMYEVGHKDTTQTHSDIYRERYTLKPYKEMQERNITLTLEKAKEWYKKGGELKEIALQAFSEEELNPSTEYIDLGLPSGTLWADTNEEGYYSYQEAIDTFGKNNLPKITDFAELYDYCKWEWNSKSKSMIVTGPNGKYIMLPALGYRNYEDGRLHFVGDVSYYWSVTPSGIYAYSMYFNNIYSSVNLLNYSNRAYGFSIRKIKRK